MSRKFQKITAQNLRKVKPGESLFENGLEYRKLRNGDGAWYGKTTVNGKVIRELLGKDSEGYTQTRAAQDLGGLTAEARDGKLKSAKERRRTFEKAADDYLLRMEQGDGKNLTAKRQHLRDHLTPFFGETLLSQLSAFDTERYRKHRLAQDSLKKEGKKISPATVNRELQTLRHLLNKAEEWGWVERSPKVRLQKENNARTVYLTPEELQRVFKAAKADPQPYIYLFMRIGAETGMRRSEILSIRVENINLQNGTIFIPKAKAGARYAHMTPSLTECLREHIQTGGLTSGFLFPANSKTGHWVEPKKPFARVIEKAGLTSKKVTAHVLRHSFASLLMQSQTEITAVATLTGHKSLEMVNRYAHQDAPWLKQAMQRLDDYIGGTGAA